MNETMWLQTDGKSYEQQEGILFCLLSLQIYLSVNWKRNKKKWNSFRGYGKGT